jgi:general stress protein YciG
VEEEKSLKGFARLSKERRVEIAQRGGQKAQRLGKGYKWNHEKAVEAGRRGGTTSRKRKPQP